MRNRIRVLELGVGWVHGLFFGHDVRSWAVSLAPGEQIVHFHSHKIKGNFPPGVAGEHDWQGFGHEGHGVKHK